MRRRTVREITLTNLSLGFKISTTSSKLRNFNSIQKGDLDKLEQANDKE